MSEAVDICGENSAENFTGPFRGEQSAKKRIVYEHPLNEHIRSWLRLEHLFCHISYRIKSISPWDSRAALEGLIEILDFIGRNDLKPELIKALEHYVQNFQRLTSLDNVDQERLSHLLERIDTVLSGLIELEGQPGRSVSEVPLLNSVRQRMNIPGGTCQFDLPVYHHWLQRSPKQRQNDLSEWLYTLEPLRTAIDLSLYLIRNNATTTHNIAEGGLFQTKLDAQQGYQLVRATLPGNHPCYPEISGGKHRLTIRFFEYKHSRQRPEQTDQDVQFELCCCMT